MVPVCANNDKIMITITKQATMQGGTPGTAFKNKSKPHLHRDKLEFALLTNLILSFKSPDMLLQETDKALIFLFELFFGKTNLATAKGQSRPARRGTRSLMVS